MSYNLVLGSALLLLLTLVTLFAAFRKESPLTVRKIVLLAGLLRGSFLSMGFWMSLAGAVASFLVMALLLGLYKKASLFFVSVIGALFHSFAQVLVCFLYLGNVGTVYYLPLLALFSIGAGLVIAAIAKGVIRTKALRKALK